MSDRTSFDGQRIIFAIGDHGAGCVLFAEGEGVKGRIDEHPADLFPHDCPKVRGLYEWVGTYWFVAPGWCGCEPIDADEGFDGIVTEVIPTDKLAEHVAAVARLREAAKAVVQKEQQAREELMRLSGYDCPISDDMQELAAAIAAMEGK